MLFSGTIRSNLDPAREHNDYALWNALERVNLKEYVEELELKLESEVEEGGKNLSAGQRQLMYDCFCDGSGEALTLVFQLSCSSNPAKVKHFGHGRGNGIGGS